MISIPPTCSLKSHAESISGCGSLKRTCRQSVEHLMLIHPFGEKEARPMPDNRPILVTGAAGQLGAVGRTVTGLLLERGLRVRAMVRREDERAAALRAAGAEVVVGDL